jgi:heptosyltransferase-2
MSSPVKNKTILLIRLSSFGDVLLATSTVRSIKNSDPSIQIHFVVKQIFSIMVENNPLIDRVILYEDLNGLESEYFAVIDLQNNIRSHRLIKSLTVAHKSSYQKHRILRYLYVHFNLGRFNQPIKSIPDRYLDAAKHVIPNLEPASSEFNIKQTNYYLNHVDASDLYIVVAPGAAHFTKQWPVDHYIDFLCLLQTEHPHLKIVLLGGKAEQPTSQYIREKISNCIDLVGRTSFDESASIIAQSKCVVCNDSSIMHLGAALKKPVITMFGSTTERLGFFPYTTDFRVLENNDLKCRPCTHIGRDHCPKGHFLCMTSISGVNVYQSFNELVGDEI